MDDRPQAVFLTIDADRHGIGDAIATAWIAEGAKSGPVRVVHRATGQRRRLLEALGQTVVDQPLGKLVTTFRTYRQHELASERGQVARPVSRGRGLGVESPPTRPTMTLPDQAREWARQNAPAGRFVLLFPQTHYANRQWPLAAWVELAWRLETAGLQPVVVLDQEDERLYDVPRFVCGRDLLDVAALMQLAALTVTNDSGPAHLAGTLDVPALVLLGPTNPAVLSNYGSLHVLHCRAEQVACVGCHWGAPYRPACNLACAALASLDVGLVYTRVALLVRPELTVDPTSGLLIRRGALGRQDLDVVREVVLGDCYRLRTMAKFDRSSFVLDVGGHVGAFARTVSRHQPRASVVAVEVVPENAQLLALNCGQCAGTRATAVNAAVSYSHKPLAVMSSLVEGGVATGGSVVVERDQAQPQTWTPVYALDDRPVEAVTLEQLLDRFKASRIDLLKLDCEGSEFDILQNSPAVRDGGVLQIVGEYHGEDRFRQLMAQRFAQHWDVEVLPPSGGSIGYFFLRRRQ